MIVDFKSTAAIRGAVIWDPSRPFTLNVATNLAGVKNLVMITPELVAMAARAGLEVTYDLRQLFLGASGPREIYDAEAWAYAELYPEQSREWLANLYYGSPLDAWASHDGERDFAIQKQMHVFWLPWGANVHPNNCRPQADPEYCRIFNPLFSISCSMHR